MKYVIDASVVAKWCLPAVHEPLLNKVIELRNQQVRGQVQFVVPDLFWAEMGNVLWKAVRLGRCTREVAQTGLVLLQGRRFPAVWSESLVEQAFTIEVEFQRSVYDSIYVALAIESGCQLLTADEKLANALSLRMPVKWLGAL